ncbi:MAG: DUF4270 domain-containing protein [Dysgonamonadaceae bacterium]|jgi:hypothetical protein|nr:DUF4270 domain-containing protein [Dysgonamonadaceae bacterium]
MKTKVLFLLLILAHLIISCEDDYSKIGVSIQPDENRINIFDTTVTITTETVKMDSVYAKTVNGFLGDYYDPAYGSVKAGYVCQFYPSVGITYPDSVIDGKIDSVILQISYYTCFGDSLTPMEASVYKVNKPLVKTYYTNSNPAEFCDMTKPFAKYGYTARNLSVSDSLLQATSYLHWISIPLDKQFGQAYFEQYKNGGLRTVEDFLQFCPGFYITSSYGTGSLIAVDGTEIRVFYRRESVSRNYDDTADSTIIISSYASFPVTKEVIQLNTFENKFDSFLLQPDPAKTYIKSPAGIITKITIPTKEIYKGIGKKKFSSVNLSLKALPPDSWEYSFGFPGGGAISSSHYAKLLLIEPDSVKNFFEKQQVANNTTSYSTTFSSSTYTYDFANIANVVQNAIEKAPDKDLELYLIPVLTTYTSQSYNYSYYDVDYLTSYYLYPSGVALSKDNLKVRVIASDLEKND